MFEINICALYIKYSRSCYIQNANISLHNPTYAKNNHITTASKNVQGEKQSCHHVTYYKMSSPPPIFASGSSCLWWQTKCWRPALDSYQDQPRVVAGQRAWPERGVWKMKKGRRHKRERNERERGGERWERKEAPTSIFPNQENISYTRTSNVHVHTCHVGLRKSQIYMSEHNKLHFLLINSIVH